MEFGLMTEPQVGGTYDEILKCAQWAEDNGLTTFARSDHYYGWGRNPKPDATDAFATLAGLARDTQRIQLAVLVAPFTFRHPAVVAKNAATIDQMSNGRFSLGVGTGWNEEEHEAFGLPFPPWAERFGRLEEGLEYLRACFGDGSYDGQYYRLHADVEPKKTGPLPIIVGGSGPKRTPDLAGRFADEYNVFVADPRAITERVRVLATSAEQAGRDPDAIQISVMGPILVRETEAEYQQALHHAAAKRSMEPSELEARWKKAHIPLGTSDQVADQLAGFTAAGVSRFYVQFVDLPSKGELDEAFAGLAR